MVRIREVHDVNATLVPALYVEVAPRNRDEATVVRDAVLLCGLRSRKLEVGVLRQLLVVRAGDDDRVAAQLHDAPGLTHRARTAAPLIGPDGLLRIVAEPGGVPALEIVGVCYGGQPHRLLRVRDIDHDGMARACGGEQVERRVRGHVVAVARARVQRHSLYSDRVRRVPWGAATCATSA